MSAEEERAWRAYRRMYATLEAQLARELAATGLSMADYTVLSDLVELPDRDWLRRRQTPKQDLPKLRITELADYMGWSQSRLSHHLARMERRGLVRREKDPTDARSAVVVLTREGLRAITGATGTHMSGVRRHFLDLLTPRQLATLARIGETVVAHLEEEA
jgi:DNA-binding MarR family transcriptional regulator